MAKRNKAEEVVEVRELPPRPGVKIGKPEKIVTSAMRLKLASGLTTSGTMMGTGGNYYSPELSSDFLELPQSRDEQRNYYRFFYEYEPFVGQAIDNHVELPLSKLRLRMPKAKNRELAEKAMRFCENWAKRVKLLQKLMYITREYHLLGEAVILCEDTNPEMPQEVVAQQIREVREDGSLLERWEDYPDANERAVAWLKKNYNGWTTVRVLPPEQVKVESFPLSDEFLVEFVPDAKSKAIVERAQQGDPQAAKIVRGMPGDMVQAITEGRNPVLNTDPDAGTFVHILARKCSDYEPHGQSILQRCFLPGTSIWIKRDGVIQQVAVEDVQEGELLLTHKGRFRPCKIGSRLVNEDVISLGVEGIQEPLKLTSEHKVLRVLGDGTEEWIEAGKLQVGDLVKEGHVAPSEEPVTEIDFVEWWRGREICVKTREDRVTKDRKLTVVEAVTEATGVRIVFSYQNDDRNRARAKEGMQKLLLWASQLKSPIVATQAEVALEAGVSKRDVRVYAPRLRAEGLLRTVIKPLAPGKGKAVTWYPALTSQLPLLRETVSSPLGKISITEDFCYLLGTWLGDGCIWTASDRFLNTHSLGWALHDSEPELRDKVLLLLTQTFGTGNIKQGALLGIEEGGAHSVRVEDPLLARWFMEEFGHGARGKHLPEWIFSLPEDHLWALLRGLLDTDGCLGQNTISFHMANAVLLDQLHLICTRLGLHTQRQTRKRKASSWTRHWNAKKGAQERTYTYPERWFYLLSCNRSSDVRQWAQGSVKGARVTLPDRKYEWTSKFKNGCLTRKILTKTAEAYEGPVYSFGVAEDESHVTQYLVTHNCLRTLVLRDKIRQALTAIASRHMTPYRLVYGEDMNEEQTEALREQVDLVLQDPDYSIVTNFQVNWEEMGADQRLPDWSWVMEMTNQQLYAGLGVTESLLTGESSYSGDRIHLEVINTRYMFLREVIQDLVEEKFFAPMCRRMGFVEEDEDGNMQTITPGLSFTRLALRDTADTFDALFNLYQKGSLDIDIILDLLNIDPVTTQEKIARDMFTPNDALFNEVLRGIYGKAGDLLVDGTTVMDRIADSMGLKYEKPKDDSGRF